MSKEKSILKYNYGEKYMKIPFIIYTDKDPLLEKNIYIHAKVILKSHQQLK